jgi:hypothetical protein
MSKPVRPDLKLSAAAIDALKVELAADVVPQLKEFLAKLLADQAAIQTDRSVTGFCRRWGISRFLFYEKPAEMPVTMHVGGRTLISPEAEQLWIRQREQAALTGPKRIVGRARNKPIAPPTPYQPTPK